MCNHMVNHLWSLLGRIDVIESHMDWDRENAFKMTIHFIINLVYGFQWFVCWIKRLNSAHLSPPNVIIKFPPPKPHWDTDRPTFTCIRFYIDDN